MTRACIIGDCRAPITGSQRMCEEHWYQVPGRLRSQLSYISRCRRSEIGDQVWDRARTAVENLAAVRGGGRKAPPLTDLDAPAIPIAGVSAPVGRSSKPALAAAKPEPRSP